ncbi:unnamed protein product [Clonostachys solani]|uniref:Uncharacterized protein n=1 Tax=Clonostachys solani TaxID=160281 RepID=A0A9P0EM33_9HYPO|nr:unnamed protein product [Clonostachys solani]
MHSGKIPCRYALECNCDLIFTTTDQELPHALRFHSFQMCNVPNCVNAVSERWINGHSMSGHLRRHRQFTGDQIPVPTKIIPGDSKWEEVSKQQGDYDPLDAQKLTANDTDLGLIDEDELAIDEPEHDAYGWSYAPCDLEDDDVQSSQVPNTF